MLSCFPKHDKPTHAQTSHGPFTHPQWRRCRNASLLFVSLFTRDSPTVVLQGWKKQDIEGSLFVLRRNAHPTHRFSRHFFPRMPRGSLTRHVSNVPQNVHPESLSTQQLCPRHHGRHANPGTAHPTSSGPSCHIPLTDRIRRSRGRTSFFGPPGRQTWLGCGFTRTTNTLPSHSSSR